MDNRNAEEQIHARLRELADELRQLRRELKDQPDRKSAAHPALLRKPPSRRDPPTKG